MLVALIAGVYFYMQPPSVEGIVREMQIDRQGGEIKYHDVVYSAQWGEEVNHTGDIRYFGRAYYEGVPIFTHDAIVTTGEFSDPDIVEVTPIKDGSMYWTARKQPQGTLIVLHFIPENFSVFESLHSIREGDRVEFIGREETDSSVEASDGDFVKLLHTNHRYLLVSRVRHVN